MIIRKVSYLKTPKSPEGDFETTFVSKNFVTIPEWKAPSGVWGYQKKGFKVVCG